MNEAATKSTFVNLGPCSLTWPHGKKVHLPEFTLAPGESLGVMGPSGCGKSTWLRWILGVAQPYVDVVGSIRIANRQLNDRPIEQRGIGLVMQEQGLFPHYNVAENLAFAIASQGLSRREQAAMIAEKLAAIGLPNYGNRRPTQLSGGERARIALLRAVLAKPHLILLDEPFNGLDQERRQQICSWTYDFLRSEGIAAIIVSHEAADLKNAEHHFRWPADAAQSQSEEGSIV